MTARSSPPIVELRQYRLRPGRRDELIELFDRAFVETQEATGMTIIGQFRDVERPDHFVWLRGFDDMTSRRRALEAFYGGPVWAANRDAANATMADVDDVLLLHPVADAVALRLPDRRSRDRPRPLRGLVVAVVYHRVAGREAELLAALHAARDPVPAAGIGMIGLYESERSANDFPRLPVRDDANVLVWFGAVEAAEVLAGEAWEELLDLRPVAAPPEVRLLAPTRRSLLGWGAEVIDS